MNGSASLRNRLNATVRDIPRSGIRDFIDIVSTMKEVISLGIGEPDFDTPWHVRESTVFALERGATHYTSNFGYLELRRALARYVAKTFGAEYRPDDEVLITVGVSEALDLALRALLNPGGPNVGDAALPSLGDPKAPLTMFEFASFNCDHCARIQPTLKQVLARYEGQVRLDYINFPQGAPEISSRAAMVAICAAEQKKFWQFGSDTEARPSSW